MKRCTQKILLVFGLLLLMVFLFIPYKSVHVKYKLDPHSLTRYKMTTHQSRYMFVFRYLKLKSNKRSVPGTDHDSYVLNKYLLLIEMIIVITLASFDYFLFCVVLKKKRLGQK